MAPVIRKKLLKVSYIEMSKVFDCVVNFNHM